MIHKNLKLSIIFIFLFFNTALNLNVYAATPLSVSASNAILMESYTGEVIFEKNMNDKIFPASMTKILTALVAIEYFDLDDLIIVGDEINYTPDGSSVAYNIDGESILFKNLLRGLMIPSGNESANVIAKAVISKIKNDGNMDFYEAEAAFSELMNDKAKSLGAINSNFKNAHGFHDEDHYTTVYDLAIISRSAMENDFLNQIVKEVFFSGNGAGDKAGNHLLTQVYNWQTHNELIIKYNQKYYEYATGIKTGFTDEAGYCLAASAQKDGMSLVAIVANSGSSSRFRESKDLFEYGFNNFKLEEILSEGHELVTINFKNASSNSEKNLSFYTDRAHKILLDKQVNTTDIVTNISYDDEYIQASVSDDKYKVRLNKKINKGDIIGSMFYMLNDEVIYEQPLIANLEITPSALSVIFNNYKIQALDLFKNASVFKIGIIILTIVILIVIFFMIYRLFKKKSKYRY